MLVDCGLSFWCTTPTLIFCSEIHVLFLWHIYVSHWQQVCLWRHNHISITKTQFLKETQIRQLLVQGFPYLLIGLPQSFVHHCLPANLLLWSPLVDSIFANPVIIHIVLHNCHYWFPGPFSFFIVMMNQAIREEKNVTKSQLNFAAELVQNIVPSDIIAAGKNAAVAIWRFFDITMHICFIGAVSAIVDRTCRPGSAWPLGIIGRGCRWNSLKTRPILLSSHGRSVDTGGWTHPLQLHRPDVRPSVWL